MDVTIDSMALLHYRKLKESGGFLCAGALINENYVLTAAHCVRGSNLVENQFILDSVRLGEFNKTAEIDCQEECADPAVDIQVTELIVHENYEPESISQANDIALIRLARPVSFTDYIKPICLPIAKSLQNKIDENSNYLVVIGYGPDNNASQPSSVLRHSEVDGLNLDHCSNYYGNPSLNLTNKNICVYNKECGNSCFVDSGGSLIAIDEPSKPYKYPYKYLAGIQSFGPKVCGSHNSPVVFTHVAQYIDWILDHMKK